MKPITPEQLILRGDTAARAGLLAARLERREYRPETILTMDQSGWPGDWEGRTILALVSLAQMTRREPAYLHDIVDTVLSARGERGYLGSVLPAGEADEQQLSGHSWLLRGLIAYYGYTGRADILDAAVTIGRNLFLPLADAYDAYPVRPEDRVYEGEASGHVAKKVGCWHISTDTGCAFIPLDGLSALYEASRDPDILALLRRMIPHFTAIDFTGIRVQTHATLTGIRGILRTFFLTGEPSLLHDAERLFRLYTEHGMTANYANCNWFGRPEWTEPCAVIDSFLCAMQLYCATENREYLTLAQRIYYNGLGFGQRENGGFGCDSCLGMEGVSDRHILRVIVPEAYWCCSMRGGEGLASVGKYAVLTEEETRRVTVPFLLSGDVTLPFGSERLSFTVKTGYPFRGDAVLTVTENTLTAPVTLSVYLPDAAEHTVCTGADAVLADGMLKITVTPETETVSLTFSMPRRAELPVGLHKDRSRRAIFSGNLMLAIKAEEGELFPAPDDPRLEPLFLAYETDHAPRQALFRI